MLEKFSDSHDMERYLNWDFSPLLYTNGIYG